MYQNLTTVIKLAEQYQFTVGAFNMHNLEMLPSMIRAAKNQGAPIIIQTSVATANYIGMKVIVAVCQTIASEEAVDVVLHLDHATEFADIKAAIAAGYTSVMYDGSHLPFHENLLTTKTIAAYAHQHGVSIEAVLGTITGVEDGHKQTQMQYTDPLKAQAFVNATKVDALAVSVGTCHGAYQQKTKINFTVLQALHEKVPCPLVIHGGTGVKDEDIKKCIDLGVRKFNVGTELLVGWTKTAKQYFMKTKVDCSLRHNITPCNDTVQQIVETKIGLFLNHD